MSDDHSNEEKWLYGESEDGPHGTVEAENSSNIPEPPGTEDAPEETPSGINDQEKSEEPLNSEDQIKNVQEEEETQINNDVEEPPDTQVPVESTGSGNLRPPGEELEEGEEDDDSDESDDNVRVTIGDIKTTPQYGNLNVKRNAILSTGIEKQKGKFSIDEFESIGTINGVSAHEYSIDALEDKPWRKPGADITDYFNYGFNEESWRAYCERQKAMRIHESGSGLGGLGMSRSVALSNMVMLNEMGKFVGGGSGGSGASGMVMMGQGVRGKAGPPPGLRRVGVIDVIGSSTVASRRNPDSPPKESPIQVMTADKRDYGRKLGFEVTAPSPYEPSSLAPLGAYPGADFFPPEMDPYYSHYDRTIPGLGWVSQDKSTNKDMALPDGVVIKQEPPDKTPKERERDRERHKERHRHRSRSRSVERRSRKHKSRSRSPSHRSHKKKKSKKAEKERERGHTKDREHEPTSD